MNYVAAMLLIHIDNEAEAFWCFYYLLFKRNWRKVYDNNTPKLMSFLKMTEEKLERNDPQLFSHLKRQEVSMAAVFSPIFLTLFIYRITLSISKRIFECFILDGETVLLNVLQKMLTYKR